MDEQQREEQIRQRTYDEPLTDAEMDDLLADPIESLDEAAEDIEEYIVGLRTQLAHERQRAAQYRAGLIGIANEAVLRDEPTIRHLADAALTTTEEARDDD